MHGVCKALRSARPLPRLLVTGLVAAVTGCQGPPAFEVRWELARSLDGAIPVEVTNAKVCSERGVGFIEMRVFEEATGALESRRTVPCFDDAMEALEHRVDGPPVSRDGDYLVTLRALDRDGRPWIERAGETPGLANNTGLTSFSLGLREGDTQRIEDPVVITTPTECFDGIDNDVDGLVDGADNACARDVNAPESLDFALTQIVPTVTFFDDNPSFRCPIVGVDDVRVTVLDALGEPRAEFIADCPDATANFGIKNVSLEAGTYTLEVVALDSGGEPMTSTLSSAFVVNEGEGAAVSERFDFPASSFDPAIELPMALSFQLTEDQRQCEPVPSLGGLLVLDGLRFRVLDDQGVPVNVASFDIDGTPTPDGGLLTGCTTNRIDGPTVVWGTFSVEAEMLVGAQACFRTEATALAPRLTGDAQRVVLERVRVDGELPEVCRECFTDGDCSGLASCVDGICAPE